MKKICCACGTQYPENYPAASCFICNEERQYVPESGQTWTTREKFLENHKNKITALRDRLFEIVIEPAFGIGQRAFLLVSKHGNILWDCIPLLDDETAAFIRSKGGLKAIAISHPHYYSNMNDWAALFDCPVYLHQEDASFIAELGKNIVLWEGKEKLLWDDMKIIHIGGHFSGSSVLLIPSLSEKGTLLCGDTLYLSPSKKHFALMYSYPNRIPLPLSEISRIKNRLDEIDFDSIYGFYSYQNLTENVKEILHLSMDRYLQ